jgi:hypothetical protein
MALTVGDIITARARVLLRDTDDGGIQWTDDELLSWFNEGCSEVARLLPESASVTSYHSFVAGTQQAVPSGGTILLEVLHNADADGTPGRVIRRVERHTLDNERPDWHTETAGKAAKRYIPSLTDPRVFHVFPPNDGNGGCVLTYATAPDTVSALTDSFPLPSIYAPLVVNYVCYRAHQKMLENAQNAQLASEFYQLFITGIQGVEQSYEGRNAKVRDPIVPERR